MPVKSMEDRINAEVKALVDGVWSHVDEWKSRHDEAEGLIRDLANAAGASPLTLSNYGAILSNQGRHERAVEVLERAVAAEPDFREPYFNLAVALMNTTVGKEPMEFFERAAGLPSGEHAIEAYFDPHAH